MAEAALAQDIFAIPFHYVETGIPGFEFVIPHLSNDWVKLKRDEKEGKLDHKFPRLKKPSVSTLMTRKMYNEMRGGRDEHGNIKFKCDDQGHYKTDNPVEAWFCYRQAQMAKPESKARLLPGSKPIPEGVMKEFPNAQSNF